MDKSDQDKSVKVQAYFTNPISLGLLLFVFGLNILTLPDNQKTSMTQIMGGLSLFLSLCLSLTVICGGIREFLSNHKNYAHALVAVTFPVYFFNIVLSWVRSWQHLAGLYLAIDIFFGFVWIVLIVLALASQLNLLSRFYAIALFVAFLILSTIQFFHDWLAGTILLVIALLVLVIILKKWAPFDKVPNLSEIPPS